MKFPLKRGSWLWLDLVWPGGHVDSSPIRCDGFRRSQAKLRLQFFHVNYPAGVQDKDYDLSTVQDDQFRIEAQDGYDRRVKVRPLTWELLGRLDGGAPGEGDLKAYCDRQVATGKW